MKVKYIHINDRRRGVTRPSKTPSEKDYLVFKMTPRENSFLFSMDDFGFSSLNEALYASDVR